MNVKPLLITASVGAFILSGCAQSGKTLPAESFVARTIPTGSARLHRVSLTELDAFFAKFPSAKRRRLRTVNQNQTGDGTNPTCDYGDALVGYDDCQVAANLERIGYAKRVQAAINRIKDPTNRPGYVNGISGFIQQLQTAWRATRFGQAKSDAEFYKHAGDFFQHSYPNLTTDEVELYNAMARYPAAASPDPTLSPFVLGQNGNTIMYLMENQAWRDAGAGMLLRTNLPEYYVAVFNNATKNVVTMYPVSFNGAVKALAQLFSVSENDVDS